MVVMVMVMVMVVVMLMVVMLMLMLIVVMVVQMVVGLVVMILVINSLPVLRSATVSSARPSAVGGEAGRPSSFCKIVTAFHSSVVSMSVASSGPGSNGISSS